MVEPKQKQIPVYTQVDYSKDFNDKDVRKIENRVYIRNWGAGYKATNKKDKKEYIVKIFETEDSNLFQDSQHEVDAYRRVDQHANIANFYKVYMWATPTEKEVNNSFNIL